MLARTIHFRTHLLHEALRRVLGEHVVQKGSLVEPKRLRFDFAHSSALTVEQIDAVEQLINQQIRANVALHTKVSSLDDAKKSGAMALFSEKYAEVVRVVSMGDFSTEICGGTHVARTGDIGLFKIVSESACAAGVRRIEAVTGMEALNYVNALQTQLQKISESLKTSRDAVHDKIAQLLEQNKQLTKDAASHKQKMAHQNTDQLSSHAKKIGTTAVLIEEIKNSDRESLRHMIDQLKSQLKDFVVLLATVCDEKIIYIAAVSENNIAKIKAPDLLKAAGGKGGGRADMAQGGGENPAALVEALKMAKRFVDANI